MLMKNAIALHPELCIPYSYTTRARRPESVENDHYRFITVEEFEIRIKNGEFLEWARYGDNYYGTRQDEVENALTSGKVLLKEMEVQGARQVRDILSKEQFATIFIDAGPWDELAARVKSRAPITDEELEKRRQRFEDEVTFKPEADHVVENFAGKSEEAKAAFEAIIEEALGI